MSSDRHTFHLDEVFDFRSGLSKPRSAFGTGFPFLTFKDVFYNHFVPKKLGDLVETSQAERVNGDIRRGDVFLTRTSETQHELGMSCVALADVPNGTFNGFTKRLRPKPGISIIPEYVGYYFRSPDFRQNISAISTLSTRASLNEAMLARLKIELPNPDVQLSIGTILKSLDDKIDLLREMNRTLEEIARTLFRAWFVDFAPVRAKAAGATSFRGMPQALFDTLPDSLEPSEIGEIPKGWQIKKLDETLGLAYGKSLPSPVRTPGEVAVYGSGGFVGLHNQKLVAGPAVIVGRKGTIGSIYWEDRDIFPIDTVFYLLPKQAPLLFLYHLLQSLSLSAMNTDAAVPGLNRNNVYRLEIAWPEEKLIETYVELTGSIWLRRSINLKEINALTTLRDTLLPKLITGELQAPDLAALGLPEASDGG